VATSILANFQTDVEADLEWRQKEVRAIKRSIVTATSDEERNALRRALITVLYAHLEGGFKIAVSSYIRVINDRKLEVQESNPHIAASAWAGMFKELANSAKKNDFFRNSLPDDAKLHAFARHAEFVTSLRKFEGVPVSIDDTKIVDTEGNIDQVVIAKILFRLGLPPNTLERKFADLQYLRKIRNPIAHGERELATEAHCQKYEQTVFAVLSRIRDLLSKAISEQSFLRAS